jgi:hypothetical protein
MLYKLFKMFILEVDQGVQAYTPKSFLSYMSKCEINNSWLFVDNLLVPTKVVSCDVFNNRNNRTYLIIINNLLNIKYLFIYLLT